MRSGSNIKIKINIVRSGKSHRATTCQLWTNTAKGLARLWDDDKYA